MYTRACLFYDLLHFRGMPIYKISVFLGGYCQNSFFQLFWHCHLLIPGSFGIKIRNYLFFQKLLSENSHGISSCRGLIEKFWLFIQNHINALFIRFIWSINTCQNKAQYYKCPNESSNYSKNFQSTEFYKWEIKKFISLFQKIFRWKFHDWFTIWIWILLIMMMMMGFHDFQCIVDHFWCFQLICSVWNEWNKTSIFCL